MNEAPKLGKIEFIIASPTENAGTLECKDIKRFWQTHWQAAFDRDGSPEAGWETHFDKQNLVVGLRANGEIMGCHLYTNYDVNRADISETEYFSYLSEFSIRKLKALRMTNLMTLEYLGVSAKYSRNQERVSLGKLLVALGSYVGESLGFDAVIGTPISSTKVHEMMQNVGSVVIEDKIPKYGYTLSFESIPTKPRIASQDESVARLAEEIWESRKDLSGKTLSKNQSQKSA